MQQKGLTELTNNKLTNIYCLYDDNRCTNDECDLGFLKKFLTIYIKVYLKDICINQINVEKCQNQNTTGDTILNGISWFQENAKQNDSGKKINTLYLYIGNGYINNYSDRCITVMYHNVENDDTKQKMCYYTINKSNFALHCHNDIENKKYILSISNILKVCLNELFSNKDKLFFV